MPAGGARANAGRKKGGKNKRTAELAAAVAKSGLMPLEYMLKVMRNPKADIARRDDMSKAAAPYIHPRLQAQVNPLDPTKPPVTRLEVGFVSAK